MAVAWRPARARPSSARMSRRVVKFGAKAEAMPRTAAEDSDSDIIAVRLHASDRTVSGTTATAMAAVDTEMVSETAAGDRCRSVERAGRSAWTQYSVMKVVIPAASSARVALRNPEPPRT